MCGICSPATSYKITHDDDNYNDEFCIGARGVQKELEKWGSSPKHPFQSGYPTKHLALKDNYEEKKMVDQFYSHHQMAHLSITGNCLTW